MKVRNPRTTLYAVFAFCRGIHILGGGGGRKGLDWSMRRCRDGVTRGVQDLSPFLIIRVNFTYSLLLYCETRGVKTIAHFSQPFFSSELTSRDGQTVKVQTVVSFDPEEAVCTQGSPNIMMPKRAIPSPLHESQLSQVGGINAR